LKIAALQRGFKDVSVSEEKKVSEELISKAEKFDEIEEIVSQAYEEDSDADLVTIGEAVASYLGYL